MENFSAGYWSEYCIKFYSPYLKKVVGKLIFTSQTHIGCKRSVGHGTLELFFKNLSYYTWNDFLDCLQFEYYCTLYLFRRKKSHILKMAYRKATTPCLLFSHQNTLKKMHRIVCYVKYCTICEEKHRIFHTWTDVQKYVRICTTYQFEFMVT